MYKNFISFVIISFLFLSNILFADDSQGKFLIAFSSDATKNDKQQIFIMDENGDGVKQVAFIDLNCFAPVFSPDGTRIIFRATDKVSDFLYMIDLNDTSTFRFPTFIDGGTDQAFSSDGKYLLYRSEKLENNAIYILDLSTDASDVISDGSMSVYARFSPEGNKIIYTSSMEGNMDLVILNLEDTSDNAQKTIVSSKDAEIMGTFSPDGKLIAYASFDINYKGTVHICKPDGKSDKSISKGMGSSYNPKFSPDGKMLAFVSDNSGKHEFYICNVDGSGMKKISNNSGSNSDVFDWSSDSKLIAYEDKSETTSSINVYNLEKGKSENLTGSKAYNINPAFTKK
jgi:Tol biopolymer transport system component